jgi:acid phosphatase family membrane protein YuiD
MNLAAIFANRVLWSALAAWFLAQALKTPLHYLRQRKWEWSVSFGAGGMPSSHSALVVAAAHAIGLHYGFDHPAFGLAVAVAMIVVYDAAGVRRQAGIQAQKINILVNELLRRHPISQQQLREVLGHTPLEAFGGVLLGLITAQILWWLWR